MSTNGSEEIRLLAEIARWTREAALPIVRERVEGILDGDAKKRVFEAFADGTASVAAVEKSTASTTTTFVSGSRNGRRRGS
jgi:hypothetical protein